MVAKVLWTCVMQVQRKFRRDSIHVAPLETAGIFNVGMIPYGGRRANVTRDSGSTCLGEMGASVWGVSRAGYRFLCAGKYIAPLIEHEWGSRQHPAHEGVTSPGILFMTWRAQGVMNLGYLCSCSRCAVTRHLEQ